MWPCICACSCCTDASSRRLERVQQNLARTGLTAEIIEADALDWQPPALFDAVLLDAPCTATGTFRRNPEVLRQATGIFERACNAGG